MKSVIYGMIFLAICFPGLSLSQLTIENNTNENITLYVTSTGMCPAKENRFAPAHINAFVFSTKDLITYCRIFNPCYMYLYVSNDPAYTKICNGTFVGTMEFDMRHQIVKDLFVANTTYSVEGKGTNKLAFGYH